MDPNVAEAPGERFQVSGRDTYCLHPDASPPRILRLSSRERRAEDAPPLDIEAELVLFFASAAATAP